MEQLEILHKASDLINKATRVLFLTSAGMSADSNIPTFRDKNGYWRNFPPFKKKNLEAQDLAVPGHFAMNYRTPGLFMNGDAVTLMKTSLMKGTGSSTNGSKTGMDSSTLLIPMVCI